MKTLKGFFKHFSLIAISYFSYTYGDNQTPTISPILPDFDLPFRVQIELADFILPNGLQSYALGTYNGKWLLIAGRTNGLHGFDNSGTNFPPQQQNRTIYVVDPIRKTVAFRSLTDPSSGLTPSQIDTLSVTSPQFYQKGKTLYIAGGYGIDQLTGQFSTKATLSAIDMPGLIHWVVHPHPGETAAPLIRQISHPIFQVTGGYMTQIGLTTLLVFGQNFQGLYTAESNGVYTEQVRRFYLLDDGQRLGVFVKPPKPLLPDPNYRRRDLNVVPVIHSKKGHLSAGLVAYAGVFTPSGGVWTVPVEISAKGTPSMADPLLPTTFKQGMNQYICPTIGLFSRKTGDMYTVFCGGISYGFFTPAGFQTDSEIPFINQVTTVKLDKHGQYQQYLMEGEYPLILSPQVHVGNPLLFGAAAQFVWANNHLPIYRNGVLKLDQIDEPTLIGYIVGGIQSTLPNTNTRLDSAASPYIFRVTLLPVQDQLSSSL